MVIDRWIFFDNKIFSVLYSMLSHLYLWLLCTVGAQSIAPAQSIAHGQIGDSISQKN